MSSNKKLATKFIHKEKRNSKSSTANWDNTKSNNSGGTDSVPMSMNTSFSSQTESISKEKQNSNNDYYVNVNYTALSHCDGGEKITNEKLISEKINGVNGSGSTSQKREVTLYRDENLGFGFIAGSEKPLKIRFVTPGLSICFISLLDYVYFYKLYKIK